MIIVTVIILINVIFLSIMSRYLIIFICIIITHYVYTTGRLAMLGIVVMLLQSYVTQTPVLDVVNNGLGGLLF
jgi:hypothetical protein